jgi:drug/metabolite transporter (DMT)-like permease
MPETPAQRALTASTVCLAAAVGCLALLLPPLNERVFDSVLRIVVIALTLALTMALHWVFLGIAARRTQRSVVFWVLLAVLLFPIGGAAALILLNWFNSDNNGDPVPHRG